MTKKKEFLRKMDRLQGFFSLVEIDLDNVRNKMSDHPGLTHDDEVKLLGLTVILGKFNEVSGESITEIEDFINTHKFKP